ncbi:p110_13L [African swine fever virus]|uniref:p110_13L n=1 Tax=African swine fever virus TaxID=10497 RepID=A0A8A1V5V2_ASF|nr:p110_13L [African swine fever virus]
MSTICGYRTIHILYIWYFTFNTVHTTINTTGITTFTVVFILYNTRHIIQNLIFTNTILTIPAEITMFSIRTPIFKFSHGRRIRPWYNLFRIQDGKGSIYNWLCYPNQNTQKNAKFHGCSQTQILTKRTYKAACICNTNVAIQTKLLYTYLLLVTPPPCSHVYFISCIWSTMYTFHVTVFTHFTCNFIYTGLCLGITENSTVYNTMVGVNATRFRYLIFANAILSVPTEVALWYIRTPICKLTLGRMLGSWYVWYFMCENADCVPQQKSQKNL